MDWLSSIEVESPFGVLHINEDISTEEFPQGILQHLYLKYITKAREIWQGRNRTVFHLGNIVVKLPMTMNGFVDNDWEGSVSNTEESYNHPHYVQYPRTRLAYFHEVPVLFMEHVPFVSSAQLLEQLGEIPEWVMCVDCGQVGFTRRNRLVAFDYGVR